MIECCSCGTRRPPTELQPALDIAWREIGGKYYCKDKEACYQAFRTRPL